MDIHAIQRTHAQNGGIFQGSILWWDCPCAGITTENLKALASRHGVPIKYLPREITPISAMKRAVSQSKPGLARRSLRIEQIRGEGELNSPYLTWGICQKDTDITTDTVEFDQLATIRFHKKDHTIACDPHHELLDKLKGHYEECLRHNADDIRGILVAITQEVGLRLRRSGGNYWIPASYQSLLDNAAALVEAINGKNQVVQLPLYEAISGTATMTTIAKTSLEDEVAELKSQLDELARTPKASAKAIAARFGEIQKIRARVQLFSSALDFQSAELVNGLQRLENMMAGTFGYGSAQPVVPPLPEPVTQPVNSAPEPVPAVVGKFGF